MTNNLGDEAPKTNNVSCIFHPQFSWLYCVWLGILLVFCVRREEYGMHRWLEIAKYLPQIVHLQTVMQSLFLSPSLTCTLVSDPLVYSLTAQSTYYQWLTLTCNMQSQRTPCGKHHLRAPNTDSESSACIT